jgi:hypothetical protein
MSRRIENTRRSNHSLFLPRNYGSPFNDTAERISELGLGRLDFERCAVAGEVIYTVEGDLTPTSQQEEEARIATLAYALKKLGNSEDAAEFMRCLNEISKEGDARYRQVVASYYYGEIAERGLGIVLKEMALIAMHLASLNPVIEEIECDFPFWELRFCSDAPVRVRRIQPFECKILQLRRIKNEAQTLPKLMWAGKLSRDL